MSQLAVGPVLTLNAVVPYEKRAVEKWLAQALHWLAMCSPLTSATRSVPATSAMAAPASKRRRVLPTTARSPTEPVTGWQQASSVICKTLHDCHSFFVENCGKTIVSTAVESINVRMKEAEASVLGPWLNAQHHHFVFNVLHTLHHKCIRKCSSSSSACASCSSLQTAIVRSLLQVIHNLQRRAGDNIGVKLSRHILVTCIYSVVDVPKAAALLLQGDLASIPAPSTCWWKCWSRVLSRGNFGARIVYS